MVRHQLAGRINAAGLDLDVVESVAVHEDIKLGRPARDRLIEHYCRSGYRASRRTFRRLNAIVGYGLHDRAWGATYLQGLWEGTSR